MFDFTKKFEKNINNAAPPVPKYNNIEIYNNNLSYIYNCTKCSSLIEILSINEGKNIIEFKCLNKNNHHQKEKMPIKEYLDKMQKYTNEIINEINDDTCFDHKSNNRYISYCFDCKCHLCEECLKSRTHFNHNKNNIIEIQPIKEELNILTEIINYFKFKMLNLKMEKENKIKEQDNLINIKKLKENKIFRINLTNNENNKERELKINYVNYKSDIANIMRKYRNEIKIRKIKYEKDCKAINNKYKLRKEKEYTYHNFKLEEISNNYAIDIINIKYDKKINDINNIKFLTEIVYNAYNKNNSNYYNSININNLIVSYYTNEYIRNNIMKKILQNNYENIIKMIFQRKKKKINYEIKEEETPNDSNIWEKIEEYEKKIKELNEENIKQKNIFENKIVKINERCKKELEILKEESNKITADEVKEIIDEIKIIYKINNNDKKIKIFYIDFVNNNRNNCKIIYEGIVYNLQDEFDVKNIQKSILEIKLKGIKNITDMYAMFYGCSSLISLPDISKWDTSNVTNMSCLFGECSSLIYMDDISKWNTKKVTNMHSMFYKCKSLQTIPDISNWDITKVTDIHGMFSGCSSLIYLPDISRWNTSNVINIAKIFKNCSSLISLPNISLWNISQVIYMNDMFDGCNKSLKLPKKFLK